MFSSWKTILFFAFLLYASSFGLSEGENDKKTENDSGGNNEALPTTPKDTGKEGKTNLTKPENSEQTPVKQSPNNYPNNSISPKENESAYGPNEDFKIFTPLSGISNVSALRQILFKSDPRVNGGKVPIAFQFCPPDNPPKEESKCNGTTGYLVCYVGQLDPKRENGGIAIKYAVGNKNNNSIFNECGKSLEAKSDSKEANEPDYDYWNNAGAKHGILVTYLSGGTFRFSASYDEKVYNYNVGEGNCLLMRLFENNSFLTGVYATGNKTSNEAIYPNEGKLYNEDFVKFANGLLIEETNLVGPWLLGADVFLRYQDKFHLSTSKNGKEECVPKFSYLYSNYLTQYSDIVLSTDKEGVNHVGSSSLILQMPHQDKFLIVHNQNQSRILNQSNTTGQGCWDLENEGNEPEDCQKACSNNKSRQNAFAINYTSYSECEFYIYQTKDCSCFEIDGKLLSYISKKEKPENITFEGDKIIFSNKTHQLPPICKVRNVPVTAFKKTIGLTLPYILTIDYRKLNENCTTPYLPFIFVPNEVVYNKKDLFVDSKKKAKV